MTSGERPEWTVQAPVGGWGPPWPQAAEIAQMIPSEQWTLIGGLMVQLHAVRAGVPPTRATVDVDMILHIETGAATFGGVRARLEQLGYELQMPVRGRVHRFVRSGGVEQVDVMVADHLAPRYRPRVSGREVFAVPAGTSALRKTVDCLIEIDGVSTKLSVPDILGGVGAQGRSLPRRSPRSGASSRRCRGVGVRHREPHGRSGTDEGKRSRQSPSPGRGVGRSGSSLVAVDARATPETRTRCVATAGSGSEIEISSAATKYTIMRHFVDCRSTGRGRGLDRRFPRRRCGAILHTEAEALSALLAAVGPVR